MLQIAKHTGVRQIWAGNIHHRLLNMMIWAQPPSLEALKPQRD